MFPGLIEVKRTVFIEEDHQYKVSSRARQDARQQPRPGRPSGDAMSFWGYKFRNFVPHANSLAGNISRFILRIELTRLLTIMPNIALL
ncbi:hypothetical protein DID88_006508 [Monilinia fructigena]|uniref:Uncharacterized protein n=1 Tax=Monilinia fructigena TaxID=38457 RepID=A0A395II04_9HELO|nr:hypothetical protein DID88_006508 [Monilinia fructigena]